MKFVLTIVMILMVASQALAQVVIPPRPDNLVSDNAEILGDLKEVAAATEAVCATSGVKAAVLTIADSRGEEPKSIATRAINDWGLGSNSVLLLVVINPKKLYIQPGDAQISRFPNNIASNICSQTIAPHMKERKFIAGTIAGLGAIKNTVSTVQSQSYDWPISTILIIVICIVFVILFVSWLMTTKPPSYGNGYNHTYGGSKSSYKGSRSYKEKPSFTGRSDPGNTHLYDNGFGSHTSHAGFYHSSDHSSHSSHSTDSGRNYSTDSSSSSNYDSGGGGCDFSSGDCSGGGGGGSDF